MLRPGGRDSFMEGNGNEGTTQAPVKSALAHAGPALLEVDRPEAGQPGRAQVSDPRDFYTILAALRCYQAYLEGRPIIHQDLEDIATNGGESVALDAREVDQLCERFCSVEVEL